jgi:hypothetical protein
MISGADLVKASVIIGWLGVQTALIVTSGARPEHAFGFRMFGEASTLQYSLSRIVREGGQLREVPCPNGKYSVGPGRDYDWHGWVRQGGLGTFDRELFASYGVAAQLARLHAAVDSFAAHVPGDNRTLRFVMSGWSQRNGGSRVPFRFESPQVNP